MNKLLRIMCNTNGEFHVEQRKDQGWEQISPNLGKGKDGFYAAKQWLENEREKQEQAEADYQNALDNIGGDWQG